MTTQTKGVITRAEESNERLARQQIDRAVERAAEAGGLIDTATARLIAAASHEGADTTLARFAATGELDPNQARTELATTNAPSRWRAALQRYLTQEVA